MLHKQEAYLARQVGLMVCRDHGWVKTTDAFSSPAANAAVAGTMDDGG